MKKLSAVVCLPVLFCSIASAAPGPRGMGVGFAGAPRMGEGYFSIGGSQIDLGNQISGYGVNIGFGSKLSQVIGITTEFGIFDIHDSASIDDTNIDADGVGYHASIGPEFYLTPELSVFATAGILRYSFDYSGSLVDSGSMSETTGMYGGGVRFRFTPQLSLQLAYKAFEADNLTFSNSSSNLDSSIISLGLTFNF